MPDWTYHPLSPIVASVLGEHRTRVWAMKALALLVTRGGRKLLDSPGVRSRPGSDAVAGQIRGDGPAVHRV